MPKYCALENSFFNAPLSFCQGKLDRLLLQIYNTQHNKTSSALDLILHRWGGRRNAGVEMLDYFEEKKKLPLHVQVAHQVMIAYENSPEIASWEDEQAELIFEEVERERDFLIKPWIEKYSLNRQQCIDGVKFWLEIRRFAEEIALDIIYRWLERDAFDIESLSTNESHVDWAINAESEEDEFLWDIRSNDPLLYGELCIETWRITNALVSGRLELN